MTTFDSTFMPGSPQSQLKSVKSDKILLKSPSKNDSTNRGHSSSHADNDSSFAIARNLAGIKERRKLMESNAQLLLNRLQALSQEEHKLKKNALEMKKRAQELLQHRLTREQQKNKEEKEQGMKQKAKMNEQDQIRQVVAQARSKARSEAKRIQDLIVEKRRKEAEAIRLQRVLNQEKIIQAKVEHVDLQKVKAIKVKQQEELAMAKINEYHQVKAELMREEREKMVRDEEERILQKESEIERLALEEDLMLEMLNKAAGGEAKAVTEYDEISKLGIDDLANKYSFYLKTENSRSPNFKSSTNYKSMLNNSGLSQSVHNKSGAINPLTLKSYETIKPSHYSP